MVFVSKALVVFILLGILLFAGCASQGGAQGAPSTGQPSAQAGAQKPAELKTAVCGNGIKEEGETSDNCCKDAGCPATFKCQTKSEGNQTIQFCAKTEKKDTYEVGKIKSLYSDVKEELSKESSLIDFTRAQSKLSDMNKQIEALKTNGYDTSAEVYFYSAIKTSVDGTSAVVSATSSIDKSSTLEQRKTVVSTLISTAKAKVAALEALKSGSSSTIQEADELYGYEIDSDIDSWNALQKQSEKTLIGLEKGWKADVSITSVDKKCYRYSTIDDSGTLSSVKIKLENTGGFTIESPQIDIILSKDGSEVASDTKNIWTSIEPGDVKYEELSIYESSLKCDQDYQLTINVRDGPAPAVYGTAKATFKIS